MERRQILSSTGGGWPTCVFTITNPLLPRRTWLTIAVSATTSLLRICSSPTPLTTALGATPRESGPRRKVRHCLRASSNQQLESASCAASRRHDQKDSVPLCSPWGVDGVLTRSLYRDPQHQCCQRHSPLSDKLALMERGVCMRRASLQPGLRRGMQWHALRGSLLRP